MELMGAVFGRRSCRRYLPDEEPDEVLPEIIEAGMWAPSAANRQLTHFIVVRGDKRDGIAQLCREVGQHSRQRFQRLSSPRNPEMMMNFYANLGNTPMIILVYIPRIDAAIGTDPATVPVGSEEADRFNAIASAAAAVQNMCLAAHAHGLGSIWMSLPRRNCHAISEL